MSDQYMNRTIDLLGLADVERWGVVRTLRPQSVAEHSFAVAVIALEILDLLPVMEGVDRGIVLEWALAHDAPETFTGDISGRFKNENPAVRDSVLMAEIDNFPWHFRLHDRAGEKVHAIIKLADRIEAYAFIRDWGHGARADDVKQELWMKIDGATAHLAEIIQQPHVSVTAVMRQIRDHSTSEYNCIQMRRHRAKI